MREQEKNIALAMDMLPEILTAEQIARYLGIGYVKALSLIKYGDLPSIKIGNTYRISKQLFKEWVNNPAKRRLLTEAS